MSRLHFKLLFCGLILFCFGSPVFSVENPRDLIVRVEPSSFSPDQDGIEDQIFFYPVLNGRGEVQRWRLDISSRKKVVRLNGSGFPALIKWDGIDRKGKVVSDGVYHASFYVWGEGFKYSASFNFRVDRKPPLVSLALSTPAVDSSYFNERPLQFIPQVNDDSRLDRWQLQILNSKGGTVALFWSTGPVTPISWDGHTRGSKVLVTKGVYRAAYSAWDIAGNESTPVLVDFKVDVPPREMLATALKTIQYYTTPLGLIVQLPSARVVRERKGRMDFTSEGADMLRDVAVLINAYPDAPVNIEGYSQLRQAGINDKGRSSSLAWKVYSFLVKEGGVPPSRLYVRGRGDTPTERRQHMDVLVLKNGVEVVLEGSGDW